MSVPAIILRLSVAVAVDLDLGEEEQKKLVLWLKKAYELGQVSGRKEYNG